MYFINEITSNIRQVLNSSLSKYLPISWKQRKEQSHAQCHVTHRIRIFDKISEHVKVAKSVDIAVPELAVTY